MNSVIFNNFIFNRLHLLFLLFKIYRKINFKQNILIEGQYIFFKKLTNMQTCKWKLVH